MGEVQQKERNMTINELYEKIRGEKTRSAFGRGVTEYALEMLDSVISGNYGGISGDSDALSLDVGHLLNHVEGNGLMLGDSWGRETMAKVRSLCDSASMGGNFIIYDGEIVERLCPPSARKRNRNKARELECRALYCAVRRIHGICRWELNVKKD